jgi:hypothetical protein
MRDSCLGYSDNDKFDSEGINSMKECVGRQRTCIERVSTALIPLTIIAALIGAAAAK